MGLKSIEMQVAIPRTQDASKMQDQATRQGQNFQEKLAQNELRQEQLKRTQVNKQEDVRKGDISDEDKEKRHDQSDAKKREEEEEELNHPYLGNNIDFSG